MSFTVHAQFYYLTEVEGVKWRQHDYNSQKIKNALKGDEVKGYFELIVDGKRRTFKEDNIDTFLPLLYAAVADKLAQLFDGELAIVPIPNSEATVGNTDPFRSFEHAAGIADALGPRAHAVPALRWSKKKAKAHEGGSRDSNVHFENLTVAEPLNFPVVLFDDIITTGSQMIGAYRRLVHEGITPEFGIVCGRATKEQHDPVWGWTDFALDPDPFEIDWDDF